MYMVLTKDDLYFTKLDPIMLFRAEIYTLGPNYIERWWRLLSCHYNQVLYCRGKVQEAPANPDIQEHIPHSSWEGV